MILAKRELLCGLFLLFITAACSSVPRSYEPYKVEYANGMKPLVEAAVIAYAGDMAHLEARSALLLGWVHTSAKDKARAAAAKVGGTHVVKLDENVVAYAQPFLGTSGRPFGMQMKRYDFAVFRIEESHWAELPELLRPNPRRMHW